MIATVTCIGLSACNQHKTNKTDMKTYASGTFGYDLNFLASKDSLVILTSDDKAAQLIVSAKYQAKVFTSTARGLNGKSLGYINYKAVESDTLNEHMNGYGGENRFWIGPEGGRYSVFFEQGSDQIFDNWHTPKAVDSEKWEIVQSDQKSVWFTKEMRVMNYLGKHLEIEINRKIRLLDKMEIERNLGIDVSDNVSLVGYETENDITNLNDFEWNEASGTVCIWMLDMFNTAPESLTIVPFIEGDSSKLGHIATTDYFGEIPSDRLKIKNNLIFLKTDGNYRSKLGVNSKRTKGIAGNYDPEAGRLTITTFDVEKEKVYLNQEWNPEKNPLVGDALNAYNDGTLEDGSIMGPFLELESSSPAAFLKPGSTLKHTHRVFHFVGGNAQLSLLTEKLFGVSVQELKQVF